MSYFNKQSVVDVWFGGDEVYQDDISGTLIAVASRDQVVCSSTY